MNATPNTICVIVEIPICGCTNEQLEKRPCKCKKES